MCKEHSFFRRVRGLGESIVMYHIKMNNSPSLGKSIHILVLPLFQYNGFSENNDYTALFMTV